MLLKVIILIIILLLIFHYKKYMTNSNIYQIDQQELEYIQNEPLYNNLNPLIITFIEDNTLKYNIEQYKLFGPISIDFNYFILNNNSNYLSHSNEILLVRVKIDTKIELINPKYFKHFVKINNKSTLLNNYSLLEKEYNNVFSIEITLHEYNILYIPRFWLFKCIDLNNNIEFFTCNNIFTKLFNIIK